MASPPSPDRDARRESHLIEDASHTVTSPESHMSNISGMPPESSTSSPVRKDIVSSTPSTAQSIANVATAASHELAPSSYSGSGDSPSFASQAVFSVHGGNEPANRRASRRRTGPLTTEQRRKAALIRKLGACADCRRRRVACDPNHHNTTWEDAAEKYNGRLPPPVRPSSAGRPPSPAPIITKNLTHQDPSREMDLDSPTHTFHHSTSPRRLDAHQPQQFGHPHSSEARFRTPLPSGPRPEKAGLEKGASIVPAPLTPLPSVDLDSTATAVLQSSVSRILSNPFRSRYSSVMVLVVCWDEDAEARGDTDDLRRTFERYNYQLTDVLIPSSEASKKNSSWWLWRKVYDFIEASDQRDLLKIVYYTGQTYLDGNKEMVLARSKTADPASAVRWSSIQQMLEGACADTLILMDAAYYATSKLTRHTGVLEILAASGDDQTRCLERGALTRALIDQLHTATSHQTCGLSAAELHARLLPSHSPLHIQVSGNARLPSILLAPLHKSPPRGMESPLSGSGSTELELTFRLNDDAIETETWIEWLRAMPDGIKEVRVRGPYRSTFRV